MGRMIPTDTSTLPNAESGHADANLQPLNLKPCFEKNFLWQTQTLRVGLCTLEQSRLCESFSKLLGVIEGDTRSLDYSLGPALTQQQLDSICIMVI